MKWANTVFDSVVDIAGGAVGAAATKVEQSMAQAIPMILAFLAEQLGLGSVSKGIQDALAKIRKPVDKIVDKIVAWIAEKARKIIKKIKGFFGKDKPQDPAAPNNNARRGGGGDTEVGTDVSFRAGGETHHLWIDTAGSGARVMVASDDPKPVPDKLNDWKAENDKKENDDPEKVKMSSVINVARGIHSTTHSDALNAEKQMKEAEKNKTQRDQAEASTSDSKVEADEKNLANTMKEGFELMDGKDETQSKFHKLYKDNEEQVHSAARSAIRKSVDIVVEEDKKKKIGLTSWNGLVDKLKETPGTKELVERPITNGTTYGNYVHKQIEDAAALALKDTSDEERKKKVVEAIKDIESNPRMLAFISLRNQIFDKNLESQSNERIKNLFNGEGDHTNYEPQGIEAIAENNKLIVNYHYEVEAGGKKEKRMFTSTMSLTEAEGSQVVTQSTTGWNLVLKDPGTRGKTDSVNQEDANKAIEDVKQDKTKNIEFNAAHVLADQFLGSGYKSALNLITTSGPYNKQVMGDAERNIRQQLLAYEKDIVKVKNKDNYISFDISVSAEWKEVVDGKIVQELRKARSGMSPEEAEKIRLILASDVDPKLVTGVVYIVDNIYIRTLDGSIIRTKALPGIEDKIGADETLNSILIK